MRPICYDVDAVLVVWLQVNYFYGGVNQDEYNRLCSAKVVVQEESGGRVFRSVKVSDNNTYGSRPGLVIIYFVKEENIQKQESLPTTSKYTLYFTWKMNSRVK